jgi:hypothetical protein
MDTLFSFLFPIQERVLSFDSFFCIIFWPELEDMPITLNGFLERYNNVFFLKID